VGQLLDEADGVRDQHARVGLGVERADGGVEGGEQLVGDQDVAAGQRAHQRRLAGVGVADEGDGRGAVAEVATGAVVALDRLELAADLGHAVADPAAVELEGGVTGAAAGLALARGPALAQARRDVGEARQLDLQAGLAAAGVAVEDLDDHAGAVEDADAGRLLEVAGLTRRDLVVDDDDLRAPRAVRVAVVLVLVGPSSSPSGPSPRRMRALSVFAGAAEGT
jgi:hypothetical protein